MSDRWPQGVGRIVLPQSPSTNAEGLTLAPTLGGPTWILTHDQTAGHGRRGRGWVMPRGNFAATLVTRPKGGLEGAAQLSFVAALALYDALTQACGPAARLAIKWPNDVLCNGGKVAGILLESSGARENHGAVAVGIGVNLAAAPDADKVEPGALRPVSVLGETGLEISAEDFLGLLAPAFADWQNQLDTWGFAGLRSAWLARAARIGEPIIARTGQTETHGIFTGIDGQGALILQTPRGQVTIPAADVYFREER